ncbi:ATP-binding domain-containing protein [Streptococcus hyointestinalis]|uniref:ATP-binding domain-containing protein n=1 Tax=Streptococcus hyointestinalis TaxID=1337 RepID=UPI001F14D878|nr:ATP-binding domain-containing protein [Streptococcus hyointestinalis]
MIHSIKVEDNFIVFDIVLQELVLTSFDLSSYPDVCLISSTPEGHSIIRFSVKKYRSTDYDSSDFDTIVPFQVAYASSIHKAQGLEYKSVKVIIANEIEENITHSIFYTAVTRAKEQLNIYWSPETEKRILDNIKKRDNSKDGNLIKIFLK